MLSPKSLLAIVLAALNLAIGGIVAVTKLPVYLDSLGLFLSTVLLGPMYGLITAAITLGAGFFIINPFFPYYALTAAAIIGAVTVLNRRGFFSTAPKSIIAGLLVGCVAAIASAPVTAYLFGGITLTGNDAITALVKASGRSLIESVAISGFTSELVDKPTVALATYFVVRSLPDRVLKLLGVSRHAQKSV